MGGGVHLTLNLNFQGLKGASEGQLGIAQAQFGDRTLGVVSPIELGGLQGGLQLQRLPLLLPAALPTRRQVGTALKLQCGHAGGHTGKAGQPLGCPCGIFQIDL